MLRKTGSREQYAGNNGFTWNTESNHVDAIAYSSQALDNVVG